MKTIIHFVLIPCICIMSANYQLRAQISTTTISVVSPNNEELPKEPYDSTHNLPVISKVGTYVGQLVYMHGLKNKENWYSGFYSATEFAKGYGTTKTNNFNTAYQDLYGKYFYVDKIQPRKGHYDEFEVYLRNRDNHADVAKYFLKLSSGHKYNYEPWITVSYYNYINSLIGKEYICYHKKFDYVNEDYEYVYCFNQFDIKTGQRIKFESKDMWRLVEVSIEENTQRIIAIFQNARGNTTYCQLSDFEPNEDGTYNLIAKEKYDKLLNKYGSYYFNLWLKHECEVGMPEELFELMWGTPTSKRKSSYQEQWIYNTGLSRTYFYFKDKKLTSWSD